MEVTRYGGVACMLIGRVCSAGRTEGRGGRKGRMGVGGIEVRERERERGTNRDRQRERKLNKVIPMSIKKGMSESKKKSGA